MTDLTTRYRRYIDCLNARDWQRLREFVAPAVTHNGRPLEVEGYRGMLEQDVVNIPDLRYEIELLVTDALMVAARLRFDCTPRGDFLGLPVNGRRIGFTENVFYRYEGGLIVEVWSVLDKTAIEAQL